MYQKIGRSWTIAIKNLQVLLKSSRVLTVFEKDINFMVSNDLYIKNAQNYC